MLLFLGVSTPSQNILMDVRKYDLNKISKKTIDKTRRVLKISQEQHLSGFIYYAICLSNYIYEKPKTVEDFLNNFKLCDKDKYRCYVYDDSLNIVAMAIGSWVISYANRVIDKIYIEYITKLNPQYTFEYIYCPLYCPMYFCYKDGEIIIVHLSIDGKHIVHYPLAEFKDWQWFRPKNLNGNK